MRESYLLVELLLLLPIILLAWMYIGYPLILMLTSKIRKDSIITRAIEPKVSVVICTHNESAVINRRIENILEQDYPREKLEIIIVDSSTDETANIVKEKWVRDVILLEEGERRGQTSAINLALGRASGDVIVLSDAPVLYDRDTIRNVVKNFADPRVGGVTGKYDPIGGDKRVESEEKLFWKYKNMLRNLEGRVDSTTFFSGDLCAFRKELIEKVDDDSIANDVYIAIKIRKRGFRTIYDSNARFIERVPDSYRDLLTQKVRRAIGGIRETIRFANMIFNPRFGLYGMLILPTRFLYTLLNPFIFCLCLITFVCFFIRTSTFYLFFNPYMALLLSFVCTVVVIFRKSFPVKTLTMFLVMQLILLQALTKYLLKDFDSTWEQVNSTRK